VVGTGVAPKEPSTVIAVRIALFIAESLRRRIADVY
jgi:hypothetical protein